MGRIKSLPIKRATRELLEKYPDLLSKDFEKNKPILARSIESDKKTRNKISGYAARLVKRRDENK
jgi:ribosomal protein S17E